MNRTKHLTYFWQSFGTVYLLGSLDGISIWLPDLSLLDDLPLVYLVPTPGSDTFISYQELHVFHLTPHSVHLISSTTCISLLKPNSSCISTTLVSFLTSPSIHIKHHTKCTVFHFFCHHILFHLISYTTCISHLTTHSFHIKHHMYFSSDTIYVFQFCFNIHPHIKHQCDHSSYIKHQCDHSSYIKHQCDHSSYIKHQCDHSSYIKHHPCFLF